MNLLLEKFYYLGLNSRQFTEEDFFSLCEREDIRVIETSEPFSFWMNLDGESVIVLNKRLRGYKLLFTMMHELAHHFLHYGDSPNSVAAFGACNSRQEIEADAFATLAIYPLDALLSGELLDAEIGDRYLRKIRRERERLHFLYDKI